RDVLPLLESLRANQAPAAASTAALG
ncbi:MAG: hypothetical protein QOI10_4475, partial [Solirubrobacterales bacterium]|nr:hypothetical protein [Solirubrobacterales bacterium]